MLKVLILQNIFKIVFLRIFDNMNTFLWVFYCKECVHKILVLLKAYSLLSDETVVYQQKSIFWKSSAPCPKSNILRQTLSCASQLDVVESIEHNFKAVRCKLKAVNRFECTQNAFFLEFSRFLVLCVQSAQSQLNNFLF